MVDQSPETPQAAINALMASGFPFQTAVARVVQQVPRCELIAEEFPWRDEISGDQFLDLVVRKDSFIVAVECKKTQKEILIFLQPGDGNGDVICARCVYLNQIQDSTKRMELFCSDWRLRPKSAESMFCVVSTSDSGKDQRMLERDAHRIVSGTDAYALRYIKDFKVKQDPEPDTLIVPLIVTNARLFVAQYNPADIDLETGQFPLPLPATLSPVSWVRFRKAFTSGSRDVGNRTVFVVRATALATWLGKLDMTQTTPEGVKVHIPWR
jgi:hypothetical protein